MRCTHLMLASFCEYTLYVMNFHMNIGLHKAFALQKIRPELRWAVLFEKMKQEHVPMCIKDLKVDGNDLINMGYPECERGMALYELWRDTVMNNTLNDRDHALEYLKKKIKK